jgi:hypothetical protein
MKAGKHSVVMGNVSPDLEVGEGCVIIGPTDSRGNTILNTPMTVGYAAQGGSGSVVIGAFAGGGRPELSFPAEVRPAIAGLIEHALQRQNAELMAAIQQLAVEVRRPEPARPAFRSCWELVQTIATADGAINLLRGVSAALGLG